MDTITTAIKRACDLLGGQASLARQLTIAPPTVNEWVKGDRRIPAERCPEIERLTREAVAARGKGEAPVLCEHLRPDVAWEVLREQAAPQPEPAAAQG
jgi:DNA-binding transcriptional regulator YdaS (Cro superfamily)